MGERPEQTPLDPKADAESRGDAWFAKQAGATLGAKAGEVEGLAAVPFESCLVLGCDSVVGAGCVRRGGSTAHCAPPQNETRYMSL